MGVVLLVISDSFIGLGTSVLKDAPYMELVVWSTYAPVLLLIGASITRQAPDNPAKSVTGSADLFSRAQGH